MAPRKPKTQTVADVIVDQPLPTPAEAASMLGIPEREVDFVADSPAGTVITTIDGASYLRTDAGEVLFLNPPVNYSGPLAVYQPPADTPEQGDADPDTGGDA